MTKRNTLQQRARELQKAQNIGYHQALDLAREQAGPQVATLEPGAVAYVLLPTPAEAAAGITAAELGVRALPSDATPAQRARAEANWAPAAPGDPCRCSGGCAHGQPCDDQAPDDPQACPGRLVHTERLATSSTDTSAWFDIGVCDACEGTEESFAELPELPWGELEEDNTDGIPTVFDGIRQFGSGILCRRCGWTNSMVCPECDPGCGCSTGCTGWRHGEYAEDDPDTRWYDCDCGFSGDSSYHCCECGADHEYACDC
ncbi:hypothetical protein [Streptomyces lavendulae]|uniref:hypothetical protein n=1 Tax=Streptomyces lavendulae TaxID=1914 RepID=UPI0033F838C8